MKVSSIAFCRAIVLSLCLLPTSGLFAMAAESPTAPISIENNADQISADEQLEIEKKIQESKTQDVIELTEDGEINVGLKVSGTPIDQSMTIFLPTGDAYGDVLIPLGEFADILSLAIKVNPGDKKAEGFFVKEENTFQLDLNSNEVLVKGKKRALSKNEAIIYGNDIYVRAASIQEWFDINPVFDMGQLIVDIRPHDELPFQERAARLANAKKHEKVFRRDPVRPENAELAPYKTFSFPSLYLTNSVGLQANNSGTNFLGFSTLQGNQDIAKFETSYTFSGRYSKNDDDTPELNTSRITFQRRDQLKNLLGPLHAGKVALGDISFPSVPLFLGGDRGSGVLISSDPRLGNNYANNSDNFILDGDAPVGYDAELYRNGAFIDFQQIGPDGRYSFEHVTLTPGFNNFEIILYGPQGQKTVINRAVTRGSRQLKKGELQYDFAAGMPHTDFLPLPKDASKDYTAGASGQLFYGFSDLFTMGASVYSGPEAAQSTAYDPFNVTPEISSNNTAPSVRSSGAALSASSSFYGINVQGQALVADRGRSAYETSANTNAFGANLGISHTTYKNFLVNNQEVKDQSTFSIYRGFGGVNLGLAVDKTNYLDKESQLSFDNTISFSFKGISIYNDLVKTYSKDPGAEDFYGEIAAATTLPSNIRFRAGLSYNLDPESTNRYRQFSFSAQKSLSDRTSLRLEGAHDFAGKVDTISAALSRDYRKFGLDLNASANTENNYSLTVGMRMALQPDQDNKYHLVDPRSGGQAALGARAFIDKNENGIFDQGDKLIENVAFRTNTNADQIPTNKNGVAYLTNLSEAPMRLSVVQDSIPDIYLAPEFDHRDLIPRRGSTPIIDFPFVKMSEIAGYLTHLKEGVKGVIVKLLAAADGSLVEQTETDDDGYFIFPAVKGGNYKVSFGLPSHDDFMSLNIVLDANVEDPEEYKVEASDELAQAAKEAAALKPSASAADANVNRMNAPAGDLPNIDDPINEEDLKKLDEKAVESIITQ